MRKTLVWGLVGTWEQDCPSCRPLQEPLLRERLVHHFLQLPVHQPCCCPALQFLDEMFDPKSLSPVFSNRVKVLDSNMAQLVNQRSEYKECKSMIEAVWRKHERQIIRVINNLYARLVIHCNVSSLLICVLVVEINDARANRILRVGAYNGRLPNMCRNHQWWP
jgi:hypothetical protein